MKILFCASYSGTSGANQSLAHLAKILEEEYNNEVKILLPSSGPITDVLNDYNIDYKIVPYYPWVHVKNGNKMTIFGKMITKRILNKINERKLNKVIDKFSPEIIHINASTIDMGATYAIENKVPLVWHFREFIDLDLDKWFDNEKRAFKLFNQSSKNIAISESVKAHISEQVNEKSICTIYNGIDIEKYKSIENLLFNREKTVLTIAGRIVSSKGIEDAVMAVIDLNNKGYLVELNIVGEEGNEKFKTYLHNMIREQNAKKYIKMIGYQKAMEQIWGQTDIALVCSKSEAFGRVTVEAMMAGCVVVGANSAGTDELIEHMTTGLKYENGNFEDLSQNIEWILKHKSDACSIALNGKKKAFEIFSAKQNANKIYTVYKEVIDQKGK